MEIDSGTVDHINMGILETHAHRPGVEPIPAETLEFIRKVRDRVGTVVVGQDVVVERLLIALFTGGHLLLQGVPGLAKTLLVAILSKTIDLHFARIQFTVDLLPSDIIGSEILDQRTNEFRVHKGPIFTKLLLAVEINRAAPKFQIALLEDMQERRVTIGNETFKLPARSWSSPPRTRSSRAVPSSCRKHSSTGSCSATGPLMYPQVDEEKEILRAQRRPGHSPRGSRRRREDRVRCPGSGGTWSR